MNFKIITLFPEAFESYLKSSIIGRAIKNKKIKIIFYDLKKFSDKKGSRIDGRPYGGGPGMVIEALPVYKALKKAGAGAKDTLVIFFESFGKKIEQPEISKIYKKYKNLILVCGRYEGIDARVRKAIKSKIFSIGPYILSGGELPAMVLLDSVSRYVPGVMGSIESIEESRISTPEVYTRPEKIKLGKKEYRVPKILLSGHHQKVETWKVKSKIKHKSQCV